MSSVQRPAFTVAQYLDFELGSTVKHEYYRGEIFGMPGGSFVHSKIKMNLSIVIGSKLMNQPCQALDSDMRVKTHDNFYTYPDLSVYCGEPEIEVLNQPQAETLINPTLIAEVLSPSTANYDLTSKFELYQQIKSFRQYLLVAQDHAWVEVRTKQKNGKWKSRYYESLEDTIRLTEISCEITLAEVYAGVTFAEV
jgi:Uma2 family endonuclease